MKAGRSEIWFFFKFILLNARWERVFQRKKNCLYSLLSSLPHLTLPCQCTRKMDNFYQGINNKDCKLNSSQKTSFNGWLVKQEENSQNALYLDWNLTLLAANLSSGL